MSINFGEHILTVRYANNLVNCLFADVLSVAIRQFFNFWIKIIITINNPSIGAFVVIQMINNPLHALGKHLDGLIPWLLRLHVGLEAEFGGVVQEVVEHADDIFMRMQIRTATGHG